MKFHTPDELRAWLDRKPPPREQDLEVANRPPEEWPASVSPRALTDGAEKVPAAAEVAPGTTNAPRVEPGCPFDERLKADE